MKGRLCGSYQIVTKMHKAPGNGTYFEAKDPATGQAQTPHQAEDTAKHPTPDSTNQHKAKHPIQNQLKEEEEEI